MTIRKTNYNIFHITLGPRTVSASNHHENGQKTLNRLSNRQFLSDYRQIAWLCWANGADFTQKVAPSYPKRFLIGSDKRVSLYKVIWSMLSHKITCLILGEKSQIANIGPIYLN